MKKSFVYILKCSDKSYYTGITNNINKRLIEHNNGIDRKLLTAKGFGETELVNKCADGVECSEAEHQMNRRSEFIVLKMN